MINLETILVLFIGGVLGQIFVSIHEKIKSYKKKDALLKSLAMELEINATIVRNREAASLANFTSKYLLTQGMLDPVKDRNLVKAILHYLVRHSDFEDSILCMGTNIHNELTESINDILDALPKNYQYNREI